MLQISVLWRLISSFINPKELYTTELFLTGYRIIIEDWFKYYTKSLNDEQKSIVRRIIFSSRNILILGDPGTGKSFLLKTAADMFDKLSIPKLCCAFTGLASEHIEGMTLHRTFPLKDLDGLNWDEQLQRAVYDHNVTSKSKHVLFIDEISMVSAEIFEKLYYLRCSEQNKKIVVCGDFLQLQPIEVDHHSSLRKYFFHNYYMSKFDIVELKQPMRHADISFLNIIKDIRKNNYNLSVMSFLETRRRAFLKLSDKEQNAILHLYYDNDRVNKHNQIQFQTLTTPTITTHIYVEDIIEKASYNIQGYQHDVIISSSPTHCTLLEFYNAYPTLEPTLKSKLIQNWSLKEGCDIMFTKNIYDLITCSTPETCGFFHEHCIHIHTVPKTNICNGNRAKIIKIYPHNYGLLLQWIHSNKIFYYAYKPLAVTLIPSYPCNEFKKQTHVYINNIKKYKRLTNVITTEEEGTLLEYYNNETKEYIKVLPSDVTRVTRMERTIAYIKYYPITLAYALTVCKSEGMTLDQVVLSFDKNVPSPQINTVAISRCRTADGVYVQGLVCKPTSQIPYEIFQFYETIHNKQDINDFLKNLDIRIQQTLGNHFQVFIKDEPVNVSNTKKEAEKAMHLEVLKYIKQEKRDYLFHQCSFLNVLKFISKKRRNLKQEMETNFFNAFKNQKT